MKKKLLSLTLILCLASTLTACTLFKSNIDSKASASKSSKTKTEDDSPDEEEASDEPTSTPIKNNEEPEVDVTDNDTPAPNDTISNANWQDAYVMTLSSLKYTYPLCGYCIYDIDKSGTPELIVRIGTCEADYGGLIYEYDLESDSSVQIGDLSMGHTSVCSYTDGNGVVFAMGHMGYQSISIGRIENGRLAIEESFNEDINDEPELDYTPVNRIVIGSVYIQESMPNNLGAIYLYDEYSPLLNAPIEPTYIPSSAEEELYTDVIYNDGMIIGISATGYGGDTGMLDWDTYIGPGCVDEYSTDGYEVKRYCFTDVDMDNETECIVYINGIGMEESNYSGKYIILKEFDGNVYAYSTGYLSTDYVPLENGSFRSSDPFNDQYGCIRFVMRGERAYEYYVQLDEKHNEISWTNY